MKKKFFASFTLPNSQLKSVILDDEQMALDLVDHFKNSTDVKLNKYAALEQPETLYEAILELEKAAGLREIKN